MKLLILTPPETSRSERGYAPTYAANDNAHLHLVADNTEGVCNKLSRIFAFYRGDRARQRRAYRYDIRGKVSGTTNGAITGDDRTYNYDDLGRLTSSTGAYTYDTNNRLTSHKIQ